MNTTIPAYQKRQLIEQGFLALKTIALFWSPDKKPNIADTANEFSIENNDVYDWMDHENVFAIVHIESGLLGYFRMKRFCTAYSDLSSYPDLSSESYVDSRKRFIGLDFANVLDSGDTLFVPVNQMRTLMFPEGEYFIMAMPVGRVIVAYKGQFTLKMWY
jgi:hypothetical protein